MKRQILFAMLLLCSIGLFAQHRSEQKAIQIANEFFGKKTPNKQRKLSVVPQQKVRSQMKRRLASATPSQNSSCYIVNDEANNRFVIVSADERMYEILGYSDNGCFEAENAPDGLIDLIGGYDQEFSALAASGCDKRFRSEREAVAPIPYFVKSQWGQDTPYNIQCPLDDEGQFCATGCVATAMAQAINYYKKPDHTHGGNISYKTSSLGRYESFNYNLYNIDWSNILDLYDDSSSDEQKQEVARLMHACGVSVYMNYNSSSGAYSSDIPYAMINNFGYNTNIQFVIRDYYDIKDWHKMMHEELAAKRPILYNGSGSGGHEFIIDGMNEEGLYHINFGWDGSRDGFFSIDAINPYGDLNAFYLGKHYNNEQGMVIGVSPESVGTPQDIFYVDKIELDTLLTINKRTTVRCADGSYYFCYGNKVNNKVTDRYTIGVGVFDKDWQLLKSLGNFSYNFSSGLGVSRNFTIRYDSSTFIEDSQYYIALYAQHKDSSKPTLVRTMYGNQDWYRATTKDGRVYLERKKQIDDTIPGGDTLLVIPKGPVGNFTVSALDRSRNGVVWQVSCVQDAEDTTKYYIKNIDPVLSKEGVSNTVQGYMKVGDFMRIPRQSLGGDFYLENYSADDSLTVQIQRQDGIITEMSIINAWGTVKRTVNANGEGQQSTLSNYSDAKFKPTVPDSVIVTAPNIWVNDNNNLIISREEDVEVYYTLDGTPPTNLSIQYTKPVPMTRNCTIKAIAFNGEVSSEVAEYVFDRLAVATPVVDTIDVTTIKITTETASATIYYTLDGSDPKETDSLYSEPFTCLTSATIKAIAVRDGWNPSAVVKYEHVVLPVHMDIVVTGNNAGELGTNIKENEKLTATSLKVSGKLNGTDIKLIREMITDGHLNHVDIGQADIVSGGEPYFEFSWGSSYSTEDNVVGTYMFAYLEGLMSIVLPETTVQMASSSFYENDNIKEIRIPQGCTQMGNAISFCDGVETVYIPAGITKFNVSNFFACPKLKTIIVDEGNDVYCSVDGVMFSKDKTKIVRFPTINSEAYAIPNTVNTIGEKAFYDSDVKNVEIPSSVTNIQPSAFNNCKALETLTIPNSVISLGGSVFNSCSNLTSISLSDELEKIESSTFTFCNSLRTLYFGKKINKIEPNAFNYCPSLQRFSVDEANSVYSTNDGILFDKDCERVIRCPEGLYADELRLTNDVKEIGDYAFMRCTNIRTFVLPPSLETIGAHAFDACSVEMFDIPDEVFQMGSHAFYNCDSLRTAIIPANVTEIPNNAYALCYKLAYVNIHEDVRKIGNSAFRFCRDLNNILCRVADIDSVIVENLAFDGIPAGCTWRVPAGCTERYKAQPWWVSTWRIVEDAECTHETIVLDKKIRTFCSTSSLDFSSVSELKAYIASGFDATTGEIVLTRVEKVPAKTGVILTGKAGSTYQVAFAATDMVYSNLLKGVTAPTEITNGYVLEWDGDDCQFAAVDGSQTLKAGEAYLDMPNNDVQNVKLRFGDGRTLDEVMGISGILSNSVEQDNAWYTLQGVRIEGWPTRQGIYIHQGHKVSVRK